LWWTVYRKIQGSIAVFLLFLLFIFDEKEKFIERRVVVKAFKQSNHMDSKGNQDTACITSIDDTVKFVYGHTEAFVEISRGNCITDQRI